MAVTPIVMTNLAKTVVQMEGRGDQARIDVVQAKMAHAQKRKEARANQQPSRVDYKKAAGLIDFSMMLSSTGVANITREQALARVTHKFMPHIRIDKTHSSLCAGSDA